MLITSNDYSNAFLKTKRLLLDSCILNDWVTDEKTESILKEVEKEFVFVFCNISMLEVGLGPTEKADTRQVEIAKSIYDLLQIDNVERSKGDFLSQTNIAFSILVKPIRNR